VRSLRTWLALGLVLAIALPTAAAAAAWLAASAWQSHRARQRSAAAARLVKTTTLDAPELAARLARLGVEAELSPGQDASPAVVKAAKLAGETTQPPDSATVMTPGLRAALQGPDAKRRLGEDYTSTPVQLPNVVGTLFVHRPGVVPRLAAALGAAALALTAALALAVSRLQRWVLRPLAGLAADADRIAGGELAVAPVDTRAREVDQVGEAMHGMAGALGSALGASAAAERDRRFLVSAIAHDLRTPLFTLRGSLEAIERGIGDGDALARAQRKADHLDRLVGDLFVFTRAEYGAPAREPIDLLAVARQAAETVDPGPIGLEVLGEGPVRLRGDPVALQRVLTNLLDNAIRHARTRVEIRVSAGRVEVADDGPGFPAEDLPHVFEPLFRGDRARGGGGAGLGLAIARRLARAHGGDVSAGNDPAGARVIVTLP
jgi:signal transduction histidine kinase